MFFGDVVVVDVFASDDNTPAPPSTVDVDVSPSSSRGRLCACCGVCVVVTVLLLDACCECCCEAPLAVVDALLLLLDDVVDVDDVDAIGWAVELPLPLPDVLAAAWCSR